MKKTLKIIAGLLLLAILLIGIGVFRITHAKIYAIQDGPSMEPTIRIGQKLLIQPYAKGSTPQRGDIVEYTNTSSSVKKYAPSGLLIHRVVALPGEKVKIAGNQVTIFTTSDQKGFNPDTFIDGSVKTYPNMEVTVPQNAYFVLGDNRPNALDSRSIGSVPLSAIVGKINP